MGYLALLIAYSAAQLALGVWVARRVKTSTDFFVAGRTLGPGLIFATMLAASIGAYAYFTTTGAGSGTGTVGTSSALVIHQACGARCFSQNFSQG